MQVNINFIELLYKCVTSATFLIVLPWQSLWVFKTSPSYSVNIKSCFLSNVVQLTWALNFFLLPICPLFPRSFISLSLPWLLLPYILNTFALQAHRQDLIANELHKTQPIFHITFEWQTMAFYSDVWGNAHWRVIA